MTMSSTKKLRKDPFLWKNVLAKRFKIYYSSVGVRRVPVITSTTTPQEAHDHDYTLYSDEGEALTPTIDTWTH